VLHNNFSPIQDIALVSFESQKTVMLQEHQKENARYFSGNILRYTSVKNILQENCLVDETEKESIIEEIISLTGIVNLLHRDVTRLSTGEFRKVLISRALVNDPKLLILDEPLEGLDRSARRQISKLINRLVAEQVQIIMVTHRITELPENIENIICLKDRQVVNIGQRKQILTPKITEELYGKQPPRFNIPPQQLGFASYPCPDSQKDKIVVMRKVLVKYDDLVVINNLDWTIRQGENWMLTGPNGSGKSTLLSLISGDAPQAYANEIYLFGKRRGSGESIWEIKKRIGLISSEFQLRYQRNISILQVILSGFFDSVGLYRHATSDQKQIAMTWAKIIGFDYRTKDNFNQLSFGEQKLVLIARAMVKAPELLIFDEPCQGLDPENRKKVLTFIDKIGQIPQNTLIYVTHHKEEELTCIHKALHLKN
jgi:molybdate transport system ATP-binding protein